jgi:hypothetical protein
VLEMDPSSLASPFPFDLPPPSGQAQAQAQAQSSSRLPPLPCPRTRSRLQQDQKPFNHPSISNLSSALNPSSTSSPSRTTKPPTQTYRITKSSLSNAHHKRHQIFDPWNTTSSGHQTDKSGLAGSTGWRDSRTRKLAKQLSLGLFADGASLEDKDGGAGGGGSKGGRGRWIHDSVGAGSLDWVDELKAVIPRYMREGREGKRRTVVEMLRGGGSDSIQPRLDNEKGSGGVAKEEKEHASPPTKQPKHHNIFSNCNIYINGSMAPLIGDHRLKYLIAEHGGQVHIALRRKTITHVILGRQACSTIKGGSKGGGGFAAGKIQKEVLSGLRGRGESVRFISAEW